MKKRVRNPQTKHLKHEMVVEPTTTAHHKFVIRCADCGNAYVCWTDKEHYEAYMSLRNDKSSDAI